MDKHSYLVSGTCNVGTFCLSIDAETEELARTTCAADLLAAGYYDIKITKAEISRLVSAPN